MINKKRILIIIVFLLGLRALLIGITSYRGFFPFYKDTRYLDLKNITHACLYMDNLNIENKKRITKKEYSIWSSLDEVDATHVIKDNDGFIKNSDVNKNKKKLDLKKLG